MEIPKEWAIFPLHPITEFSSDANPWGVCGCGTSGCKNAGKHPAFKWSTLEPGEKTEIPEGWGIGLATGTRSGVVVVDLDSKPSKGIDGLAAFTELAGLCGGVVPETLIVRTPSGGWHLYFRHPGGMKIQNSSSVLGPGIDVRGDGGYVVLPDSLHKSGGRYEFFGDIPGDPMLAVAELPEWLLGLVSGPTGGGGVPGVAGFHLPSLDLPEGTTTQEGWAVIDRVVRRLKEIPEGVGRRNATLFELCATIGDHSHVGEIALDDARQAIVNQVFVGEGWDGGPKDIDTMERGFAKGRARERVMVVVGPDHEECNNQAILGLRDREDVYVIGNRLARDTAGNGIAAMTRNNLAEILSKCVDWRARSREGDLRRTHPPDWAVGEVYDRGFWEGLRVVEGFSDVPLLRADGTIADTRGYDPGTRVVLSADFPVEKMTTTEAVWVLRDLVCDYPFASDSHLSAWVCSVLTPLAMYAFTGPMPIFLFEASAAGSGKTLLASISGLVATGKYPGTMTYRSDDAEMRKTVTAFAMSPKPVILIDNVVGEFGGAAVCAAVSDPDREWSDRVLGGNSTFRGKINAVWYVTANNIRLGADVERRVCPVRLVPTVDRPELRTGFRHEMPGYVMKNQPLLTAAALTILRDYVVAGRPVPPAAVRWGSYGGWYDLVVGATSWAGFGTPDLARESLRDASADKINEGAALVEAWSEACDNHDVEGLSAKEMYDLCYPRGAILGGPADGCAGVREWMESHFPKGVNARVMGYVLREYRDKMFGGVGLRQGKLANGYRKWFVR